MLKTESLKTEHLFMKTTDIRRAAFEEIFAQVKDLRRVAWFLLKKHGPGTTRELSRVGGMDLLTLRPRVTELCQLGFAYLAGRAGKEGVYAARDYEQAREWLAEQNDRQLELSMKYEG